MQPTLPRMQMLFAHADERLRGSRRTTQQGGRPSQMAEGEEQ